MSLTLPAFLPGHLLLARGDAADYRALSRFHYVARRPATWAQIRSVRYAPNPQRPGDSRIVAVGVLSYPVPSCRGRERFFHRSGFSRRDNLRFANANLRTISRIIVHPQFRCLGLARTLVQCLCARADTRYVEAIAMMGRAHPFFESAGMQRVDPPGEDEPVYFVVDRHQATERTTSAAERAHRAAPDTGVSPVPAMR